MNIGYVCTNFNNSSVTAHAVKTLLSNTRHNYFVVAVDNKSDPAEIAALSPLVALGPNVEIIRLPENIGYFAGLNVGIRHLRTTHPEIEWMIVGNNDLQFPPDFGDRLEQLEPQLRQYAVVSPDIVTGDGEHQNPHVIESISRAREISYDLYYSNYFVGILLQTFAMRFRSISDRRDEQQWQHARTIYQGHGSCYLLGPRFFNQFTELWAPTFLMSEEYFLSKQLSDVGQKVYYEPAIQVLHLWHASLAKLPSRRRWELAREAHREYRKYVKIFG